MAVDVTDCFASGFLCFLIEKQGTSHTRESSITVAKLMHQCSPSKFGP